MLRGPASRLTGDSGHEPLYGGLAVLCLQPFYVWLGVLGYLLTNFSGLNAAWSMGWTEPPSSAH